MLTYDPFVTTGGDLYALYERLRDEAPVYWAEETGAFVLSRYEDVASALADTDAFSSDAMRGVLMGAPTGKGEERLPRSDAIGMLVSVDPPAHSELRRIVSRGFTPRQMAGWHNHIDETVRMLLDAAPTDEPFDVIAGLGARVPVRVIAALVGADPDHEDRFRLWADAATSVMSGSARVTGMQNEEAMAMMAMAADLGERIDARREEPRDDLLTAIVRAQGEDVLTREEAVGFAALLLFAGTETTTNLIGNAVAALLAHPDELERVQKDPSRISRVMEETLRWDSPVQYVFRRTTRPVERHGVMMPVDANVTLLLGAANRDPRKWGDDAHRFDPGRDASGHVAFGFGPHFCLGAALARAETSSALEHLLPRLRGEAVAGEVEWVDSMQFRGRRRLPVTLSTAPTG
ncbi:MAG: cytochrome P450 [Acidimicrobiia bacterium]|nr:cytochrome P450 [Acidimicrobiia bacterium]